MDHATSDSRARRVVFVSGNFNVLHPGHLRLLRFAAEAGDHLVVGVNPDGTPGVTVPAEMRIEALRSVSIPLEAVPLAEPPESFIARARPSVVVKGKEFETLHNPERAAVESYGGRLLFSSGDVRFASIALIEREYFRPSLSRVLKPGDYPRRHGFDIGRVQAALGRLAGLRVMVIGDLIVDEYITCDPVGMSQEDPTIVVTPIERKTFVGGAGIVAAHARALGADVQFVSVTGEDATANYARETLVGHGVDCHLFEDSTRPTTRKERFRAAGKTLLRVNHMRQHAVGADIARAMLGAIDDRIDRVDLILFSDFNYGCLPQPLVDTIVERARARSVMMAADSQASSQIADIARFKGMALITPTEHEARLALHDFTDGLAVIADRLQKRARATNVVITLGAEGLLVHAPKRDAYLTDRLPAFNTEPRDPAGAGDSFFTALALALRAGIDIWMGVYLANIAAACQVSRVGNTPVSIAELTAELALPAE